LVTSNNYHGLLHIDDAARDFMIIPFTPTRVLRRNPTTNWMMEWDVATFIEALEEAYPLAAGDRHLGPGQRWLEVAHRVQSTVQVLNHDMAALRNTLIAEVNTARHSIGEIPAEHLQEIL